MADLTKEGADALAASSLTTTYTKAGVTYTADAYKSKPVFEPAPIAGDAVIVPQGGCSTCQHTGGVSNTPGTGAGGGFIAPPGGPGASFAPDGAAAPITFPGSSSSSGLVAWLTAPENRLAVILLALLLVMALRDRKGAR